jgi:hypothetical protein
MDSDIDIIYFILLIDLFISAVVYGWKFNPSDRVMRNKEIIMSGSKLNTLWGVY